MRFKYTGKAGIRRIGKHEWNEANDFIQDVEDPDIQENLLTYPGETFVLLDDDAGEDPEKEDGSSQNKSAKKSG